MATVQISGLPELLAAVGDDWLEIEEAATGLSYRIKKSNLIGAILAGGGTIDTGGHTLTIPATGTAALLGTAQTFSALKTFSAGISFGQSTLKNYEEGVFTPTLSFSGSSTGITYSVQSGAYTRIGNKLFYEIDLRISSKGSASGQARIHGLPFTVFGNWGLSWVRWTNTATALVAMNALAEGSSNQYISLAGRTAAGTGGVSLLTNNDLADNTVLLLTGFYTIA